jgi:hypothetical protein
MKRFLFPEPEKYETIVRNTRFKSPRKCEQTGEGLIDKVESQMTRYARQQDFWCRFFQNNNLVSHSPMIPGTDPATAFHHYTLNPRHLSSPFLIPSRFISYHLISSCIISFRLVSWHPIASRFRLILSLLVSSDLISSRPGLRPLRQMRP